MGRKFLNIPRPNLKFQPEHRFFKGPDTHVAQQGNFHLLESNRSNVAEPTKNLQGPRKTWFAASKIAG